MRTAEFDAFGPWIDQVRSTAEVPPLYRNFPLEPNEYRLVLKVPRNISRRDASPDMDLYDHLLAVGSQRLTILSRRGDRYIEASVAYDRIAAITDDVNLFDGSPRALGADYFLSVSSPARSGLTRPRISA